MPNEDCQIALEMLNKTLSGEGLNIKPNLNCGSPVWKLKVIPLLHISIALLCLKCHIAELPLRAGLIHAL